MDSVEDLQQGLDVLFIVLSTIFVLMMQAGFALYEVGTINRTRPKHILVKNVMDISVAVPCWLIIGHSFSGQGGNGFIGWRGFFLTGALFRGEDIALQYAQFIFSAAFAGTAVTVVSGAVADRVSFLVYIIYREVYSTSIHQDDRGGRWRFRLIRADAFVTCLFTYPILAHWAWAENGWASPTNAPIDHCGVLDFAGSSVVHAFAGASSLVWASLLGEREHRFHRLEGKVNAVKFSRGFAAQDRPKQALGVFLMWLGWYGFNCGSTLSSSSAPAREIVAVSAVNTTIAPVVCSLTSMALEVAYHGKVFSVHRLFVMRHDFDEHPCNNHPNKEPKDLHQAAINGILAGLVTITAGAATTHPHATIPVSIFGAVVYHVAYRCQYSWGIDDAVNAAPIHLWCGIWGTIAASLCYSFKFRNTYFDLMESRGYDIDHGGEEDCGRGGQLLANVAFTVVTVFWATATSFGTYMGIEYLFPNDTKHQEEPQRATQEKIEDTIARIEGQNDGNSGTPQPATVGASR